MAWHVDLEADLHAAVGAEILHFTQVYDASDLVLTVGTLRSEIRKDRYLQVRGLST